MECKAIVKKAVSSKAERQTYRARFGKRSLPIGKLTAEGFHIESDTRPNISGHVAICGETECYFDCLVVLDHVYDGRYFYRFKRKSPYLMQAPVDYPLDGGGSTQSGL